MKAVGSWVYDSVGTLEERDLFENVLESPDKNDQFLNVLGQSQNTTQSRNLACAFNNLTQEVSQYLIVIFGA